MSILYGRYLAPSSARTSHLAPLQLSLLVPVAFHYFKCFRFKSGIRHRLPSALLCSRKTCFKPLWYLRSRECLSPFSARVKRISRHCSDYHFAGSAYCYYRFPPAQEVGPSVLRTESATASTYHPQKRVFLIILRLSICSGWKNHIEHDCPFKF